MHGREGERGQAVLPAERKRRNCRRSCSCMAFRSTAACGRHSWQGWPTERTSSRLIYAVTGVQMRRRDRYRSTSMRTTWRRCSSIYSVEKVVIAGLSMGGYVTLAFWRRHPERVAGLALRRHPGQRGHPGGASWTDRHG